MVALGAKARGCRCFVQELLSPSPFTPDCCLHYCLHLVLLAGAWGEHLLGALVAGAGCTCLQVLHHHFQPDPPGRTHTMEDKTKATERAAWWEWGCKGSGRRGGGEEERGIQRACEACQQILHLPLTLKQAPGRRQKTYPIGYQSSSVAGMNHHLDQGKYHMPAFPLNADCQRREASL